MHILLSQEHSHGCGLCTRHARLLLSTVSALSTDLRLLICVGMRDDAVPAISLLRYERSCHTLRSAEQNIDNHAKSYGTFHTFLIDAQHHNVCCARANTTSRQGCAHLLFSTEPAAPPAHLLHHLCRKPHATGIPLVIWLSPGTALGKPVEARLHVLHDPHGCCHHQHCN